MTTMKVPFYEFRESILPAKKWNLNEEGCWRRLEGLEGTNYELAQDLPLKISLPAYNEVDYEPNFSSRRHLMYIDQFNIKLV